MKISVITVCRNSASTIAFTLDSFFAQDWLDKELVIVDGGSTDETLSIIGRYPQNQIQLISEPDKGIYDAMNKGLGLFTGDAVGFLNSDDTFHGNGVLTSVSLNLAENDIVAGHIVYVDNHLNKRQSRVWKSTAHKKNGFKNGWSQPHPALYCRKQVFEQVGLFNTKYLIGADYDWMLRAYEIHDFQSGIIDNVLVDMKTGGLSTSGLRALLINLVEPLDARQHWLKAGIIDYALFARAFEKVLQLRPFARLKHNV